MRGDLAQAMPAVARHFWGEPNRGLSNSKELRWGTHGARSVDVGKGVWFDHEANEGGGVIDLLKRERVTRPWNWLRQYGYVNGGGSGNPQSRIVATYDYTDESGTLLFQTARFDPKTFKQRRPDGKGNWIWNIEGVTPVPYRLPEMKRAVHDTVFVVEGEKDADNLTRNGFVATTNAGGSCNWKTALNPHFIDKTVYILPDNDEAGAKHAVHVARHLHGVATSVRIVNLPGLPHKGDISDWIAVGGDLAGLVELCSAAPLYRPETSDNKADNEANGNDATPQGACSLDDFVAYMPTHTYIFTPSRETWPGASVNARVPSIIGDNGKPMHASAWLDRHRAVEQMTWAPGKPMEIQNRLIAEGGWIERQGCTIFNLYRPPCANPKAGNVDPWLNHLQKIFPEDVEHITAWLAHRVQKPNEKINHALVLGGAQGIGKDSLLEPVKYAVGPWNFIEVSPRHMLGRFNGFLKSVILRVNEARDLGDIDRYAFYDHMKAYTAAPPDVLRVDEKNLREYSIPNLCSVIITSNHKTNGIHLPPDDRRHYVAWSGLTKTDFPDDYWRTLYDWYASGGNEYAAGYLANYSLSGFDPKAPPPKTAAFWEIVAAGNLPEDGELADTLDELRRPTAVTLAQVANHTTGDFGPWLRDRKNARLVPYRMEACGYVAVHNPNDNTDGRWRVAGKRQVIYALANISLRDRIVAARQLATESRP